MTNKIHWNILDKKRTKHLPRLSAFNDSFYLAGGTALALQIGHRDSVDFDFFTEKSFDTEKLENKINKVFSGYKIKISQKEPNTLSVTIDSEVNLSFISYKYPLLNKLIKTKHLKLASIVDIGAMKLSAIISRSTIKDYVDLYYIIKNIGLEKLISSTEIKYPEIDTNLILKSLVYFKDIKKEPIDFKEDKEVKLSEIKTFLKKSVQIYLKKQ